MNEKIINHLMCKITFVFKFFETKYLLFSIILLLLTEQSDSKWCISALSIEIQYTI